MRNASLPRILAAVLAAAAFGLCPCAASAGTIDPALGEAIAGMRPGQEVAVVVFLADRSVLSGPAPRGSGRKSSREELLRALKAKAAATQPAVVASSRSLGASPPVSLWAVNAIALRIPSQAVIPLSRHPGVESIRLDAVIHAPTAPKGVPAPTPASAGVSAEWNVQLLRAPDLWASGIDGSGIVVATLDSGVDLDHPDVGPRWRGELGGWYDPAGQHATPYDANGHGTHSMGLLLGGSSGGTAIGIAPGARWIAAKIFNDQGQATLSVIHLAFQWLLDPDGDPSTDDAPDVVNNSWTVPSTVGSCWSEFAYDVGVLRAAGIAVVFAAGNGGGASGTSESPANDPGAFPVGAIDSSRTVAPFSGRGPSACDGSTYPSVVAGGVAVKSADLTFGGVIPDPYAVVSGTSFSAPQVAGVFALLAAAHPSATLEALEAAIRSTSEDLGIAGPDDDYGSGLPDVVAASAYLSCLPPPPSAQPDSWSVEAGPTLTVAAPGVLANDSSSSGAPLTAVLVTAPSQAVAGSFSLAADGSFTYATNVLTATTDSFSYAASDGSFLSPAATVTITIAAHPAPVAANDTYSVVRSSAATSLAVLENDSATHAEILPASLRVVRRPNRRGTATANADGTISYAPARSFRGIESFTYEVKDSFDTTSNVATVTVNVK